MDARFQGARPEDFAGDDFGRGLRRSNLHWSKAKTVSGNAEDGHNYD
jgi:hypothetical protein